MGSAPAPRVPAFVIFTSYQVVVMTVVS